MALTSDRLKELLHYDPETGVFTWRVDRQRRRAGSVAGSKNSHGYIQIVVDQKKHRAHRLAWLYVAGEFPPDCVDHKNGVRTDNRLENLRLVSHEENSRNMRGHRDSVSGFKGVVPHKNAWRARIYVGSKTRHLGLFPTPEAAHAAYCKAAADHFGEFARAA